MYRILFSYIINSTYLINKDDSEENKSSKKIKMEKAFTKVFS